MSLAWRWKMQNAPNTYVLFMLRTEWVVPTITAPDELDDRVPSSIFSRLTLSVLEFLRLQLRSYIRRRGDASRAVMVNEGLVGSVGKPIHIIIVTAIMMIIIIILRSNIYSRLSVIHSPVASEAYFGWTCFRGGHHEAILGYIRIRTAHEETVTRWVCRANVISLRRVFAFKWH